jgi:galactokinase
LEKRQEDWTKYPAAMAWVLEAKTPIQGAVASTLPPESGVSSSAAIEMAFGVLWNDLEGLGLTPLQLALMGQEAENRYVGVPCGIMDQLASALGKARRAMFVDTRSLEVDYAPLPEGLAIVLCDTGKRRQLTGGEYKERRDQVEAAARKMGVVLLRDAVPEMLNEPGLTDLERKRARHVITENLRCQAFAEALRNGALEEAGRLLAEAHASMREDFGASVAELDAMAESCSESKGCVGARLTGAGFGGACVALVQKGDLDEFLTEAEDRYRRRVSNCEPRLVACNAADGAALNKL